MTENPNNQFFSLETKIEAFFKTQDYTNTQAIGCHVMISHIVKAHMTLHLYRWENGKDK
jgi:hypothetical protein